MSQPGAPWVGWGALGAIAKVVLAIGLLLVAIDPSNGDGSRIVAAVLLLMLWLRESRNAKTKEVQAAAKLRDELTDMHRRHIHSQLSELREEVRALARKKPDLLD